MNELLFGCSTVITKAMMFKYAQGVTYLTFFYIRFVGLLGLAVCILRISNSDSKPDWNEKSSKAFLVQSGGPFSGYYGITTKLTIDTNARIT